MLESTGHLGTVTKTAPLVLEDQAKIFLQESGSFENAHHVSKTYNGLRQVCLITLLLKCVFPRIIHGAAPSMPASWPETYLPLQTPAPKLMCGLCATS